MKILKKISHKRFYSRKSFLKNKSKRNNQYGGGNASANAPKRETRPHKYYIVRCNNDLDDTILSRHLESLGLVPDSEAMKYVEDQYTMLAKRNGLSPKSFCDSFDWRLQVRIPDSLVTADVFFYHINIIRLF
jgi:hypothetical protein